MLSFVSAVLLVVGGLPGYAEGVCKQYEARRSELLHLHHVEHGTKDAFSGDQSPPHTPFLTLKDENGVLTGRVTVGKRSITRVASDPGFVPRFVESMSELHYISTIFVVDDKGVVVSMEETHGSREPVLQFKVPSDASSLRPYVFCNTHGLYHGEWVSLENAPVAPTWDRPCRKLRTLEEDFPGVVEAELMRRNHAIHGHPTPYSQWHSNEKHEEHIPSVTFHDGKVVRGTVDHPMEPQHYIQYMLITDLDGRVHKVQKYLPGDTPVIEYEMGDEHEDVIVRVYCTRHGYFTSEPYQLPWVSYEL